jgi:hypothetical protein
VARYFLHVRDGSDHLIDPEGTEHESLEALTAAVLVAARSLIAADAHDGVVNLNCRIEAEDERGEVVHRLPFTQAIEFARAR